LSPLSCSSDKLYIIHIVLSVWSLSSFIYVKLKSTIINV
jgi:hypothetical protein